MILKEYFTFDAAKPLLKLRLHFRFARHEVLSFLRGPNVKICISGRVVKYVHYVGSNGGNIFIVNFVKGFTQPSKKHVFFLCLYNLYFVQPDTRHSTKLNEKDSSVVLVCE